MKKQLLFILMTLLPMVANAETVKINGVFYSLDEYSETATVCARNDGNSYAGVLVIPETVTYNNKNYTVTSIGANAFNSCRGLVSVTIPNSVEEIRWNAFSDCSGLTSITIPNSVTTIGENAFCGCSYLTSVTIGSGVTYIANGAFKKCNSLTSVTIPEGVTSIAESTFADCSSLKSVSLPNSLTIIGCTAFQNCTALTSVTIPDNVTTIGDNYNYYGAFDGCSSLVSITIGSSVTSIPKHTFYNCSSLASIYIPNSVETIGEYAFYGCVGLKSITIGSGLTNIKNTAFEGCGSVTSIIVDSSNTDYDSRNDCNAIIEKGSNILVLGCNNTTIPDGVISIGEKAFKDCASLASIIIPESVTYIGEEAFWGCAGLTTFTIPNSVVSIGYNAFTDCTGLTSFSIGSGMKYVEGGSLGSGCDNLTSVSINCSTLDGWPMGRNIKELILGDNVVSIENGVYWGDALTTLTIGKNVKSIGANAFQFSSNLTSLTIPKSVTSIGYGAFLYCSSLATIMVESGNPVYDSRENCNAIIDTESNTLMLGCMNTVKIPNGVTCIDGEAFAKCSGLTSITIPSSMRRIGRNAFKDCTGLEEIYCYAKEVPDADWSTFRCYRYDENGYVVGNYSIRAKFHVPEASIESYRTTEPWNELRLMALPRVEGDLNYDYKVDIADAVTVLNTMAGQEIAGDADVNGDGKVDIADFVTVLNIMAGQ